MPDINKFSFAQLTSNSSGKTSASGTMGMITMLTGVGSFIAGVVDYIIDDNGTIMTQAIVVITIGAGLLGYRKSKDNGAVPAEAEVEEHIDLSNPIDDEEREQKHEDEV